MSNQQTPITEDRLKEIEQRASAAAPGPWTVDEGEPEEGCPFRHVEGWTDTGEEWLCLSSEDAAFIANARQDVPDLLVEIHRLRAKVEEQENTISRWLSVDYTEPEVPGVRVTVKVHPRKHEIPQLAPTDGNQGEGG